ncbi:hypothetical protein YC2023_045085 [Brassica napus]
MAYLKVEQNIKKGAAKTKMVWTLGAASRPVEMIEKLLEAVLPIMARKATYACWKYPKAKAIIITAKAAVKLVARCRPSVPGLLVVSMSESFKWSSHVASHGLVFHGIIPLMGADSKTIGDMISFSVQVAKKEGICNSGDLVVALHVLKVLQPLHVQ